MLRTLKKNRSDNYTKGLVITNNTNELRFPLFELDLDHSSRFRDITIHYRENRLDYVCHRSGHGWHFLSPTLLSKDEWKAFHKPIKQINPKCPMTTLRWLPNKYPHEDIIWYTNEHWKATNPTNYYRNSDTLCHLLNKIFGTEFRGIHITDLKFVRYPLPK